MGNRHVRSNGRSRDTAGAGYRKFELGQVVMTPGAKYALADGDGTLTAEAMNILHRHQMGDWGDVNTFDKRTNDAAVNNGTRLLSAYEVNGEKIWIITEADRSVTTLLLPDEY